MSDQPTGGEAPDPARSYERARPEAEAGMGRLESIQAAPNNAPDRTPQAVKNVQESRQLNAEETTSQREKADPNASSRGPGRGPAPIQPDHSMLEEEPDGWDLAPQDIDNPREKRHPRTEGKGGVP